MKFSVEEKTRDDGARCFILTPSRRDSDLGEKSTMPTSYTLVKRGKGFSVTDKGYRALVRDYPKTYHLALDVARSVIRDGDRKERESWLRKKRISVEKLPSPPACVIEGLMAIRMRKRGSSATFVILVPDTDGDSFSGVFTFLISKGKTKETADVKSFLRKFPHNGLAVINWMENEVTNGEKQ